MPQDSNSARDPSSSGESPKEHCCFTLGIYFCKCHVLLVLILWTICGFLICLKFRLEHESTPPMFKIGIIMLIAFTVVILLAVFTRHCFTHCQEQLNLFDPEDEVGELMNSESSQSIFYWEHSTSSLRKRSLPPDYEAPPSYLEAMALSNSSSVVTSTA